MNYDSLGRVYLVAAVSFLLAVVYNAYIVYRNPVSRLPGPWYSKWTCWILEYHWLNGKRCQYVDALHHKYGEVPSWI
ncbi:Cytochrome P450 [Tolypocladium paradoxum]|uniref:Cytochrome P450 n=1 Tax=Tolypocladium paradoxum TaxID=94208 RepID=A0A2S4KNS8_9HYPO|nr:Cytochrome P450 [Tolypocladium paradoxum]